MQSVIDEAKKHKLTIHRVSQGSGILLQTDDEIKEMLRIAKDQQMEVSLFVGPRATWDVGAQPLTPADLAGKRVGVRSYSQTTAVWVRGILQNDYGVDVDRVRWVTFEDGHVAEYREPAGVERVGGGKNLLEMLRVGELDAAIYGADLPNDPTLKSLIPDAETAAQTWYARHHVVPINHMVVVTEKLAKSNPQAVKEIYRLLLQAKTAAGLPKAGAIDFLAFGLKACRPALQTIITYALQQRLIPRKIEVEELFDDTTRALD